MGSLAAGDRADTCISTTGPGERPWCLRWRTAIMPGIAFWYFKTEREAREAEADLLAGRRRQPQGQRQRQDVSA